METFFYLIIKSHFRWRGNNFIYKGSVIILMSLFKLKTSNQKPQTWKRLPASLCCSSESMGFPTSDGEGACACVGKSAWSHCPALLGNANHTRVPFQFFGTACFSSPAPMDSRQKTNKNSPKIWNVLKTMAHWTLCIQLILCHSIYFLIFPCFLPLLVWKDEGD